MKFMILAYNPRYVKLDHVTKLISEIFRSHSCPIHAIEHSDDEGYPIYSVEVVDTDAKDDD